eukprot:scaffold2574_cov98-Cylindrotheca_fusiformis.AAC.14
MTSFVYRRDNEAEFQRRIATHIRIHPSVSPIEARLFQGSFSLIEVTFPEDLRRIEQYAFYACTNLKQVLLPPALLEIGPGAFAGCCDLMEIRLPEFSLRTIEQSAFLGCKSLINVRIPPGVAVVEQSSFYGCTSLVSVELPKERGNPLVIGYQAFAECEQLKNVRLPSTALIGNGVFDGCHKLHELHPSSSDLETALRNRFSELPIHEICYFHVSQEESSATYLEQFDEMALSCGQRDVYGMTPLHILALSTVPNLPLCEALCEKRNEDLMTADYWGCLPMGYFAINFAQGMLPSIKCILKASYGRKIGGLGLESWKSTILEAIECLQWSNNMDQRKEDLFHIRSKVSRYWRKELTSLMELAIWKCSMEAEMPPPPTRIDDSEEPLRKKAKSTKESTFSAVGTGRSDRQHCRMLCGSNGVLRSPLSSLAAFDDDYGSPPYLIETVNKNFQLLGSKQPDVLAVLRDG